MNWQPIETAPKDKIMDIARPDIYGWFDHPSQTQPSHDPGPQGLCPVCCQPTGRHGIDNPIKTISMAAEDRKLRNRSYFFRAHKNCWELATQDEKTLIESSVIDRAHWMPPPPPPVVKESLTPAPPSPTTEELKS